ncbi:hypothetical protein HDU86_004736 [Geranomyces michiganensis]|nr:hypothetical protein HDU86_004736 [Geranomyces michiganensis]
MSASRPLGLLDLYSLSRHLAKPAPIYANVGIALLLRAAEDNAIRVPWYDRIATALPVCVAQYPALLSKITGCQTPQPMWEWIEEEVDVPSVLVVGQSLPDFEPHTVDAEFARQLNDAVSPLDERTPLWRLTISPHENGDTTQVMLTLTWSHCLTDGIGGTYIMQALLRALNASSVNTSSAHPPPSTISLSETQKQTSFPASFEERIDTKASIWKALPYLLPTIWKPSFWAGTMPADPSKPPKCVLSTRAFPLSRLKSLCSQHGATIHAALDQLAVCTLAEILRRNPPSVSSDSKFVRIQTSVNLRPYYGAGAALTPTELGNHVGRHQKTYATPNYLQPSERDFWADARAFRAEVLAAVPSIITETGLLKYISIGPQYEAYWKKPLSTCPMGRSLSYLASNVGRVDFTTTTSGDDSNDGRAVVAVERSLFGQVPGTTSAALFMNVISTGDILCMTLATQEGCVDSAWLEEFWKIWNIKLSELA